MTAPAIARSPVRVKELQGQSRKLDVIPVAPERGQYHVASASHPGAYYVVRLDADGFGGQCSCPWGQYGGQNCKHVLAALSTHYAGQGRLSFWSSASSARRQHRRLVGGEGLYGTLRRG